MSTLLVSFFFFPNNQSNFKFSATFALDVSFFESVGLEPKVYSRALMGLYEIICRGGESGC